VEKGKRDETMEKRRFPNLFELVEVVGKTRKPMTLSRNENKKKGGGVLFLVLRQA